MAPAFRWYGILVFITASGCVDGFVHSATCLTAPPSCKPTMRMSTGAPQQPVRSVCDLLKSESFATITDFFEGWDEEDILHLERATMPEFFGFDTKKIGSYLKLTREAEQLQLGGKTITIASGAGASVMHLSSQADLDGFLLRLGAGGLLAAAATPQVVLKFGQVKDGATYGLYFA
eukprot:TRINITY_DN1921_c0_g4_i2.p2 TRINITY_DN1921_c0_g4~~TRINITY_DN1921_c0_g4_i2.p2  ORF type:complete len:197 (-),score=35.10 TRINITY_DN1921_c0_g4_i2:787-1314(-)